MFRVYAHGLVFLLCLILVSPVLAAPEISGEFSETEAIGGGQYRTTIHSAPIGFKDAQGRLQRISTSWGNGDAAFPNVVTASKLRVRTAPDGMRRIFPVPGDDKKWMEIGAPLVKNASGGWIKQSFTGPTKAGNKLTWTNPNASLSIVHAGHFVKLDIELLGGWLPKDGQFAFPVGLQGLQQSGSLIKDGETVVSVLRPPVAYDAANPRDVRNIDNKFVSVDGQAYILFTLPDLTGMSRPVVDPTLTQETDAEAARISGANASYYAARNTSTSFDTSFTQDYVGQDTSYACHRIFLRFNTASIPDSANISQVNLTLTSQLDQSTSRDFDVQIVKQDWSAQVPIAAGTREAAYDGCLAETADASIWRNTSGMSIDTPYASGNLSTSWVSKTGYTYYSLRSSYDYANGQPSGNERITIYGDAIETAAYRPQLVVIYSLPIPHRPIIISSLWDWMRYASMN